VNLINIYSLRVQVASFSTCHDFDAFFIQVSTSASKCVVEVFKSMYYVDSDSV